jgi:glutamate racemase
LSIGIFDSGIGGLTVFKAVSEYFNNLDLYYIGDTARVPYGNKSPETIQKYSFQISEYLIEKYNVDAIIIACNSASSYALEALKNNLKIPVLGVINPGAKKAVEVTKNNKIGVIGTQATIKSNSYDKAINKYLNKEINIYKKACPLFVPFVEEGMIDNEITKQIIKYYLDELIETGIDTLILGCTHYPVLKNTIREIYPEIKVVDSTDVIIKHIKNNNLDKNESGNKIINVTDTSSAFENLKNNLVGDIKINHISLTDE